MSVGLVQVHGMKYNMQMSNFTKANKLDYISASKAALVSLRQEVDQQVQTV